MKFKQWLLRSNKKNKKNSVNFFSPNEADVHVNGQTFGVEAQGKSYNLLQAAMRPSVWKDLVWIQNVDNEEEPDSRTEEDIRTMIIKNWIY